MPNNRGRAAAVESRRKNQPSTTTRFDRRAAQLKLANARRLTSQAAPPQAVSLQCLSTRIETTNVFFYDYKAVSDERPLLNLSNSPTCSCKPIWAYCRFAAGSRIPAASCLPSDYPQFTGSTAMRSCCRRRCSRSSCSTKAATSCSLQK